MNKFYLSMVKIKKKYNTNLLLSNMKYYNYYNNFNINSIQDWYELENKYNKKNFNTSSIQE